MKSLQKGMVIGLGGLFLFKGIKYFTTRIKYQEVTHYPADRSMSTSRMKREIKNHPNNPKKYKL